MADGKIKIETSVDQKGIETGLQESEKKVESFGKSTQENFNGIDAAVSKAGQTIAAFVSTAAIASAVKQATQYVIEVGSAFEASMSEVQAISGATGDELERMSAKAKQLGSSTKFSATEASQAFKYMALAGWDTSKSISAIDGVLQLAAASGMELAAASDMVTDYLSAFGMEADQATYMADMLAYAQAHSNTTAEMLGEAYKNCAANLNAAGQDIETTTALLEGMANQGKKGSEAGTQLAAIMRDLTAKMDDGAIQIGETSVAVMDAQGNFRDLTDIITDVDAATEGMGDAQKAAALASTFTSDSITGLNLILNEGIGKIAGYEEELRNSSGAATDMANTMQNNLQGKITAAGSALEGLGIAAYNYISGPAGTVVDLATGMFKGLTDLITPAKTEMEQYIEDINTALDVVEESLAVAEKIMNTAGLDVSKLDQYKKSLLELNSIENKNEYQKYQLQRIVNELSGEIPELASAYDEETGSINLTNQEIERLLENQKAQVMQASAQSALEKVYQAQFDAALSLRQAQDGLTESQEKWNQVAEAAAVSAPIETYNDYVAVTGTASYEVEQLYNELQSANEAVERSQTAYEDAQEKAAEYEKTVNEVRDSLIDETQAKKESTDASDAATEATQKETEATQELLNATIEYGGKAYQTTSEVADQFNKLQEAYEKSYESAKSSIMGQLDLYTEWSAGSEITAAKALQNFASCVSGMTNYAANLDALTQGVTDVSTNSVIALDTGFVQYLRNLGPQSASLVATIAQEINAGNVQYIKDLNNNWEQYYEVSTYIAKENAEAETQYQEFAQNLISQAEGTAKDTTEATATGINSGRQQVKESIQAIAADFTDTLTIPEKTQESGAENIAGYIAGAESEKANAESAAVEISEVTDQGLGSADTAMTAGKLLTALLGVLVAGTALAWVDGVAVSNAMNLGLGSANTAATAKKLSENYTTAIQNQAGAAYGSGFSLAQGFAGGIMAGTALVVAAAAMSAAAALAAFRATAQIHSPSAAAKADALFVPEGWAGGIEAGKEQVEDAAEETADVTLDQFRDLILPKVDTSLVIDQLTQQPQILAQSITESGTESAVRLVKDVSEVGTSEIDYEQVGAAVASALDGVDVRMDGKQVGKILTKHINAEMQEYAKFNRRGVM